MIRAENNFRKFNTMLFSVIFFLFVIKPSFALTYISDCAVLDVAGETYVLTQDIIDSSAYVCIDIQANSIVLDCQFHRIDGIDLSDTYGIKIYRSSSQTTNITIKNCILTDWYYGIYLYFSNSNTIANVTANSNGLGIRLGLSNYNHLTNITTENNDLYGTDFYSSSFNTLTNIIANNNYYGINLYYSSNSNTLTNVTANNNDWIGIYLGLSNSNTLTNTTTNSNYEEGIYLDRSNFTTITSSIISGNSDYGIRIYSSQNNLIYNNFFNNSVNVYFEGVIYANYWNTTKQSGTNIMGGNVIAGNFWAKQDGTGYSQTCTDNDKDGICDQAYNVTTDSACTPGIDCGDNVDFLPLSSFQQVQQTQPANIQYLIYKPNSYEILYNAQTEKIIARVGTCEVTSPYSISKTEFSKISITCCKGNLLKLYINSNLVNATSCSNVPSYSSPIYVAGSPSGNYFKGVIDEVRISNSSLSESLITYYNVLNILFYNPARVTLNGFYILAKISGKNILKESSQIVYPGSFGLLSILVPEGRAKIEVTPKNCQIRVEYPKEVECE